MRTHIYLCIFMLVAVMSVSSGVTAETVQITNVTVKNSVFRPTAGGEAQISFYLSQDAGLKVTIFDADDYAIRTLGTEKPGFKGVNTLSWNGRDDQGNVVADEAYSFVIEAATADGATAIYDPTSFSGGETVPVEVLYRSGHITYHLAKDARVRVRIGVNEGPLLRTLLDWAPRRAGPHAETWDGQDDSNVLNVKEMPFIVTIDAFALPQHSLFTRGSGTDLIAYHTKSRGKSALNRVQKAERKRHMAPDQEQHGHAALPRTVDRVPRFQVSVNDSGGAENTPQSLKADSSPTVSGDIALTVNLEEITGVLLANQRYEVLVFVDQEFLIEDEQGYHPYTFPLDTRELSNGPHVVTFNVATLTDQVGSGSIIIHVQND